jgi:hypothetical protein
VAVGAFTEMLFPLSQGNPPCAAAEDCDEKMLLRLQAGKLLVHDTLRRNHIEKLLATISPNAMYSRLN